MVFFLYHGLENLTYKTYKTYKNIMDPVQSDQAAGRSFTSFFAPLALQAASQGLTYPLVAMVASQGTGGALNLAGLAQSNTVMFILGTMGFGLITTGMVYGQNREGFSRFQTVTLRIGLAVIALQVFLSLPDPAYWLFERFIGLPVSIAKPAQITLMASVPVQFLFFLRIPFQVAMYNERRTARASTATIMRILLTALLSPAFCRTGLVGPLWAIVCLSVPVGLEVAVSGWLARPYIKKLKPGNGPLPGKRELFFFNLPLSIGGYLLAMSAIVLAAFIARAGQPEQMLPVYYLALGLATPVAYGATRVQEVVLAFGASAGNRRRTMRFALSAGLCLGILPLVFILPGLSELYYVRLQNLPPGDLPLVRLTALALLVYPVCVAIRAQGEGLAGLARKPLTVIMGQGVFMGAVALAGAVSLKLGIRGCLIGPLGLALGNLASTICLRLLLRRVRGTELPVAATTLSGGQIR